MSMVGDIVELTKQGISFVREGESRKDKFFTEIVDSIHENFNQFCNEHMATFKETKEKLKDHSISLTIIRKNVEDNELFERSSWLGFRDLNEIGSSPKARLASYYTDYINKIQRCLIETVGNEQASIVFYQSLTDEITHTIAKFEHGSDRSEIEAREQIELKINSVIERFHDYRTDVETSYMKLKKHCKT